MTFDCIDRQKWITNRWQTNLNVNSVSIMSFICVYLPFAPHDFFYDSSACKYTIASNIIYTNAYECNECFLLLLVCLFGQLLRNFSLIFSPLSTHSLLSFDFVLLFFFPHFIPPCRFVSFYEKRIEAKGGRNGGEKKQAANKTRITRMETFQYISIDSHRRIFKSKSSHQPLFNHHQSLFAIKNKYEYIFKRKVFDAIVSRVCIASHTCTKKKEERNTRACE